MSNSIKSSLRSALLSFVPFRRAFRNIKPLPLGQNGFLAECERIVHVGANDGAERFLYESAKVGVIWVEPIPRIFKKLRSNIRGFRDQVARQALLAERAGRKVTFNIANNNGASSSMFDLADHEKIWPEVSFVEQIDLTTGTLDDLLANGPRVDAIVIDTQGAELLVLQGATRVLRSVRFVKAEAADFPAYEGGCTLDELAEFLGKAGFRETTRHEFAGAEGVGHYYDVLWTRAD